MATKSKRKKRSKRSWQKNSNSRNYIFGAMERRAYKALQSKIAKANYVKLEGED